MLLRSVAMLGLLIFRLIAAVVCLGTARGLLYPRESESREVKVLDGLWQFRADFSPSRDEGFVNQWYSQPLATTGEVMPMPVPSSWNDITQNASIKEYIGWVWYEREAWVPALWTGLEIVLRFESAHYNAIAWVNGVEVVSHSGGHLPFQANITDLVKMGAPNRITVAINNTLTPHTLPPGTLTHGGPPELPEGFVSLNYQFDFYNYAGLHRPVKLYTTPLSVHVDDVTLVTSLLANGSVDLSYTVDVFVSDSGPVELQIILREKEGGSAVSASLQLPGCQKSPCVLTGNGQLLVNNPRLWWPWTMEPNDPGYLYQLEMVATTSAKVSDYYRMPVGLRTVSLGTPQLNINGKPFYFHGVDKHEDADVRT
ncbi:Beta-glucuronidase [Geodia barretti]|uniref:Beta-glucuronidase n=1 Tax=Geodia barretti TaxID=519541 RepID=A0AA35WI25_GEOBA|nr:Beta-glucuronidase [Geodia barretti]